MSAPVERGAGAKIRGLKAAAAIMAIAVRADPIRSVLLGALTTVSSLGGAAAAYATKVLIDAIGRGDVSGAAVGALLVAVATTGATFAGLAALIVRLRVIDATQLYVDRDLIALTTGIPGMEHHERPDYQDELARLRERREDLSRGLGSLIDTIGVLIQAIGTIGLLATVHPLLLLLPLAGVPSFFLQGSAQRFAVRAWEATTQRRRIAKHLFGLATETAPAKEMRLFGTGTELRRRHRRIEAEVIDERNSAGRRGVVLGGLGWLVFSLGFVAALAFTIGRAINGLASPGDVALVVLLGSQLNAQVNGFAGTVNGAIQSVDTVRRYRWIQEHAAASSLTPTERQAVPGRLERGIELRGVRFRYPGTATDRLIDVDLYLPAGATVALVGDNGAGKTTLVKLLARFYEPTEGEILIDGVPLRGFDVTGWRSVMAAGFQDFAKLELLAREAVGVGKLAAIDDGDAVRAALGRAGGSDVADNLPAGLETQLGKSFENGHELSGGQWQKVALGRAMMRDAPLLLVFDEPTASLDAAAEHALFERYAGTAQRVGATNGAITVLVSHRFSTVRMADLIVVIDQGRTVEVGSHAELMALHGLYAELFELQANTYR